MSPGDSFIQLHPQKIFNGNLNKYDCGLKGLDGNEGCVALFDYLCSIEGQYRHNIEEISLNDNEIGDKGLLAIAKYLDGNKTLGSLYLQNNKFKGDCFVMLRFTMALNRSNLHTLSLTSNLHLAESLINIFLPSLSSLSLIELHLSVCSLGPEAIPPLLSYLSSPRSARLFTLKLNGNNFGREGVETILNSLQHHNWSLVWLEMNACGVNSLAWKDLEGILRDNILTRNRFLANKVAREALDLLFYARPALLLPRGHRDDSEDPARRSMSIYSEFNNPVEEKTTGEEGKKTRNYDSITKEQEPSAIVSPRRRFPLEIDMHILSYLAPSLSITQFTRVCAFAEDRSTLPSLTNELSLPTLSSLSNTFSLPVPDAGLQSRGGLHPYIDVSRTSTLVAFVRGGGNLETQGRKSTQRKIWLKMVGCDRYENFKSTAVPPSALRIPAVSNLPDGH